MDELLEQIKRAKADWDKISAQEVEENYSDAMTSIERGEAEGYYYGLLNAFVILNGYDPIGDEDEE